MTSIRKSYYMLSMTQVKETRVLLTQEFFTAHKSDIARLNLLEDLVKCIFWITASTPEAFAAVSLDADLASRHQLCGSSHGYISSGALTVVFEKLGSDALIKPIGRSAASGMPVNQHQSPRLVIVQGAAGGLWSWVHGLHSCSARANILDALHAVTSMSAEEFRAPHLTPDQEKYLKRTAADGYGAVNTGRATVFYNKEGRDAVLDDFQLARKPARP